MFRILASLASAMFAAAALGQATPLKANVFPGAQNLPLFVGQAQGFFQRHGLAVEVLFTRGSQEQRDGLAAGAFEIAHSGADNAVAMVERGKHDVVLVTGGDSSLNEFIAQPDVRSVADLKGRTVIVDAPNTAFALQVKKILLLNGLKEGSDYTVKPVGATVVRYRALRENTDYAASTLTPPFSVQALAAGFRSLGRVIDLIGPYQATAAVVRRDWAKANADTLERYIAAYVEATRWAVAAANRAAAEKLLVERLKMEPSVAARCWELLVDPKFGLAPDARFDMEGFRNVLALRAEIEGDWGGRPPAPERYVDLSYYENALRKIPR